MPSRFPRTDDLSLNPYLGHWLAVTGALFLLSATALALRLRPGTAGAGPPARAATADLRPTGPDPMWPPQDPIWPPQDPMWPPQD